jgi:hypothetical protein
MAAMSSYVDDCVLGNTGRRFSGFFILIIEAEISFETLKIYSRLHSSAFEKTAKFEYFT